MWCDTHLSIRAWTARTRVERRAALGALVSGCLHSGVVRTRTAHGPLSMLPKPGNRRHEAAWLPSRDVPRRWRTAPRHTTVTLASFLLPGTLRQHTCSRDQSLLPLRKDTRSPAVCTRPAGHLGWGYCQLNTENLDVCTAIKNYPHFSSFTHSSIFGLRLPPP